MLDARTGGLQWYQQLVPNDAHDGDLTQAGPLFTTVIDDEERHLVATAGKDGVLRVLDCDTRERPSIEWCRGRVRRPEDFALSTGESWLTSAGERVE